jgi:hypothetical protein
MFASEKMDFCLGKDAGSKFFHDLYGALLSVFVIAGWRRTKGIYNFDYDLAKHVRETRFLKTDKLHIDPFFKLPEWCVYVDNSSSPTPFRHVRKRK